MATTNYAAALKRVLVHEGGFVDHPADPGGATNRGVTTRVFHAYLKRKGLAPRSVKTITEPELQEIYRTGYADKIRFDDLPVGVDYVVLDGAVNSGPAQSIKWLQRACGVQADGVIGEATLAAVEAHPDHDRLIADICAHRLRFLKALRTWKTFGRGWLRRVEDVRRTGQAWAKGSGAPPPMPEEGGNRRALLADAQLRPSKALGDAATGGGIAGGGATAALGEAKEALEPLAGTSSTVNLILAGLAILSVLLVLGGLAWRYYAKRRAAELADALDVPVAA